MFIPNYLIKSKTISNKKYIEISTSLFIYLKIFVQSRFKDKDINCIVR